MAFTTLVLHRYEETGCHSQTVQTKQEIQEQQVMTLAEMNDVKAENKQATETYVPCWQGIQLYGFMFLFFFGKSVYGFQLKET